MLQCVVCGAMATVDDPSQGEWRDAFHAPSAPYPWADGARVHVRHAPPCPVYVVRADEHSPRCACPSRSGATGYEPSPARS